MYSRRGYLVDIMIRNPGYTVLNVMLFWNREVAIMTRQHFTDQEMEQLRKNPYTYAITPGTISFTKEFKERFYKAFCEGSLPRQIMDDCGYDTSILGKDRITGIRASIVREYDTFGRFCDGRKPPVPKNSATVGSSDETSLRQLQHRVEYLEQEIEFLKKTFSTGTRKR